MVNELGLLYGIVVNRHEDGNNSARDFCKKNDAPILAEIPDDRCIAEAYSIGKLAAETIPEYDRYFTKLWNKIKRKVSKSSIREKK